MLEGICNSCGRRYRLPGPTRPFPCRYCQGIVYEGAADAKRKPAHRKLSKSRSVLVTISESYLQLVQILLWGSAAYKTFGLGRSLYAFLRYERQVLGAALVLLVSSLGIGVLVVAALRVRGRPLLWCSAIATLTTVAIALHLATGNRALPPPSTLNLFYLTAFVLGIGAALVVRDLPLPRSDWSPRDLRVARAIHALTIVASGIVLSAAGVIYQHKQQYAPLSQRVSQALERGMVTNITDQRVDVFMSEWNALQDLGEMRDLLERFILTKAQEKLVPRYLASFERYGWDEDLPGLHNPRARGGQDQVMVVFRFQRWNTSSQLVTIWVPDEDGTWSISKLFRDDNL